MPLDRDAVDRLSRNDVEKTTRVEAIEIASQQEFEDLWGSGLFDSVNQRIGSCLDDYEEDPIAPQLVPALKEVLILFARKEKENSVRSRFLREVMSLCDVANKNDVPIYFIL